MMPIAVRQKLIAIAIVTGILTVFTLVVASLFKAPLDVNLIIGSVTGLAIAVIEEFYVQGKPGAWMRRLRPIMAIPINAAAICVVFVAVQHFAYFVTGKAELLSLAHARYPLTIPILFFATAFAILALRVVGFIGARNLVNLLIGRYMRPIIERKVMLFLDLRDSTKTVEALGPVKAKAYIGKFLFDISRQVTDHGGEIYLYTGDGLVAIWNWDAAVADTTILAAIDAIHNAVLVEREIYQRDFGRVPEFRIGVHGGDVVVSEQGDTRKAIGIYGDAINIAARMEQTGKEIGVDCVLSGDLVMGLPANNSAIKSRGKVSVHGISDPIEVYAYTPKSRTGARDRQT